MSTPRTKRPFAGAAADPSQRQITRFFTAQPPSSSSSSSSSSARDTTPPLHQPVLPASIQADLLKVGMRVRKSVPEGYKTVSPSAFKIRTDNTKPASSTAAAAATTLTPTTTTSKAAGAGVTVRSFARITSSRELLPFCGINRVGGLDTQPDFHYDDDHDDQVPSLDAVPELTMSQETTTSEPSRKRLFDEEEAQNSSSNQDDNSNAAAAAAPRLRDWDGELSPRSVAPEGWGNNARVIAVPRSRRSKKSDGTAALDDVGQENMILDGDFEEAAFLVDGEKEMDLTS